MHMAFAPSQIKENPKSNNHKFMTVCIVFLNKIILTRLVSFFNFD